MTTVKELENLIKNDTTRSMGHALAGACAGATALTLLFPLDTVKTRLTTKSGNIYTYNKMISDLLHLRNINDLFRGYRIGLVEVILFQGVHFFFYNLLKANWYKNNVPNYQNLSLAELPQMPALQSVGRGCIAGLATQLITTPFGVTKARLQTTNTNENLFDVIKSIWEEDGITGFWRGMKTSVILIINPIIMFFVFERLQQFLRTRFGDAFWVDFVTGGLSKSVAAIICQPLTFIKTNLQAAQKSKSKTSGEFKSRTSTQRLKPPSYNNNNENNNINNNVNTNINNINNENVTKNGNKNVRFSDSYEIIEEDNDNDNGNSSDSLEPLGNKNDYVERTQSMSALFKHTMKNEGIGGLYQGLGPKLLHATLMYSFIFSFKEKFTYYTFFLLLLLTHKKDPRKLNQAAKQALIKVAN